MILRVVKTVSVFLQILRLCFFSWTCIATTSPRKPVDTPILILLLIIIIDFHHLVFSTGIPSFSYSIPIVVVIGHAWHRMSMHRTVRPSEITSIYLYFKWGVYQMFVSVNQLSCKFVSEHWCRSWYRRSVIAIGVV